jgi:hypothetical protein
MLTLWSIFNLNYHLNLEGIKIILAILNFHTVFAKKYIRLKLKFRKIKSHYQKGDTHRNIVTSLVLKLLKQSLIDVTSFRRSKSLYSRSALFKLTYNCGSVFTNLLDRRIYETKFQTHVSYIFSLFLFTISLQIFLRRSKPFFWSS